MADEESMRYAFYVLCLVPTVPLLVLLFPNTLSEGGEPGMGEAILSAEAIIFLCPLIGLAGLAWFVFAVKNRRPKLPPLISTAIGLAPGIIILILAYFRLI